MATNPMQRRARNSFLLGMLVMLLISGAIIGFLFMQLMNMTKKERQEAQTSKNVYVLTQDVESGREIKESMVTLQTVSQKVIPNNATSTIDFSKKQTAKVSLKKNTILTTDLFADEDNKVSDDVRKQEYNVVVLPMDLETDDYVDIRAMFPNGQDFIVVSKKSVEIPNIGGVDSTDTIWLNLSEDEILHMSCAIVDVAKVKGAKLYATKYTEAGMQKAAIPTFPVNETTSALLQSDQNVLEEAMQEIRERYSRQDSVTLRNDYINSSINSQGEQAQSNLETNMDESITNSKSSRKNYLDSLSGVSTQE